MKHVLLSFVTLASIFSLTTASSFAANQGKLQCDFSDGTFAYRDYFEISAAGTATFTASIAHLGEEKFEKMCWSNRIQTVTRDGQMALTGEVECGDGSKGSMAQSLDLSTLVISGTWKGAYPCRWLP